MQKKNAGFSFMEVLAASALFMIILLAVLPLTLGARQNLSYARENHRLGLAATSLSLAVRDLVLGGAPISDTTIENLALDFGVQNYSVFIFGSGIENRHGSSFHSSDYPLSINLTGFESLARSRNSHLIYVIVLNDHNAQAGRAISVAIDFNHTSGIWRNAGG